MTDPIIPLNKLPKLVWTNDIVGEINAQAARETGLPAGIPVIAGTADAAAEAISAGLSQDGDLMIMYGSSIFFILLTSKRLTSETFWGANFIKKDTFAVTGGMSTAGSLIRWFRDEFAIEEARREREGGENAYSALVHLAEQSNIGSNGLIVLPYFYGERTPLHDPYSRGMIFGLTLNHKRADVYRGILEAVGYGIRHNLESLLREGISATRILAVGGGVKNRLWMQLISDITNIEQVLPQRTEGACYGDAFLAGVGVGLFSGIRDNARWIKVSKTIEPNLKAHQQYKPYYEIYLKLYSQTAPLMHKLSEISG
jgi:xylulokinase